MTHWQDLKTIQDFLRCCEEEVREYNLELTKEQKEKLAGHIVSLTASDYFEEWAEEYPYLYEIEMLSSDLEWSNSSDIEEDWEKLIKYINDLTRQVDGSA